MYTYKFRVAYDEVPDFVRDIEILSTDNYENFHQFLLTAIGLKGNELASFYICDSKWNKQNEITLFDMNDEEDEEVEDPTYNDDDNFAYKSKLPKHVMREVAIKDFIEDPHQHILYEYDFINPKYFFIELVKMTPAKDDVEYPRCTHKVKELPAEVVNDLHGDDLDFDDDFSGDLDDDFDGFDGGFDDDDLADFGTTDDFR